MKAIILLVVVALIIVPVFVGTAESYGASAAVKPSVVLVHGAWADGSSWSSVVAHLQAAGYTVFCAAQPTAGSGLRPSLRGQLPGQHQPTHSPSRTLLWRRRHYKRGRWKSQRQSARLRRRVRA